MNDEQLGRVAYEAYCNHANWKSNNGGTLDPWDKIPEYRRRGWAVAARAACAALETDKRPGNL